MVEMKLNTTQDVLQQVEQICDVPEGDLRAWLHKEILLNALKFKRDDLEILDLKIINRALDEFRYAARVFQPYRKLRKVSIFGSARSVKGKFSPSFSKAAWNSPSPSFELPSQKFIGA